MTLQELNNTIGAVCAVLGIVGSVARAIPAPTWAALEKSWPRVANTFRFARAIGPDVVKAARAGWAVFRGTPWGSRIAPVVDAVDAALPRETQAPPPPPPSGQSGRASLDVVALLLAVALCLVGLGAVLTACDPIREGVMRITPGVPDPSGCAEGVQRCNGLVPEVCSASHRWWASLPPRADGSPRVCRACVVDDAGVAGCDELAADGGTR